MSLRTQIKNATDKLFAQNITLRKLLGTYDTFGESLGTDFQDFALKGLFILKKMPFVKTSGGEADMADGYCQFNTIDLETAGVLVGNVLQIEENGLVLFNGETYKIVGITPLAPDFLATTNTWVLYQFLVKKEVK